MKWTDSEDLCAYMAADELRFFSDDCKAEVIKRLKLPRVANFAFAPGSGSTAISTFVPQAKVCRCACVDRHDPVSRIRQLVLRFTSTRSWTNLLLSRHSSMLTPPCSSGAL